MEKSETTLSFPFPVLTCLCSAGVVTALIEEEGAASALGPKGTAGALRRGREEEEEHERFVSGGESFGDAIKALCVLAAVVARAEHPGAALATVRGILSATTILCAPPKQNFWTTRKRKRSSEVELVTSSYFALWTKLSRPTLRFFLFFFVLPPRRFFLFKAPVFCSPREGRKRETHTHTARGERSEGRSKEQQNQSDVHQARQRRRRRRRSWQKHHRSSPRRPRPSSSSSTSSLERSRTRVELRLCRALVAVDTQQKQQQTQPGQRRSSCCRDRPRRRPHRR